MDTAFPPVINLTLRAARGLLNGAERLLRITERCSGTQIITHTAPAMNRSLVFGDDSYMMLEQYTIICDWPV